jgi:hypothetical protein
VSLESVTTAVLQSSLSEGSAEWPERRSAEQVNMTGDPAVLDEHRGMAAHKATEIRRRLAEVEHE